MCHLWQIIPHLLITIPFSKDVETWRNMSVHVHSYFPLANLVEIQAGVSQTRDNCTGFKLDSGKALKICGSQGMWDPRSFRAFRFVSNPFSLLLFHQDWNIEAYFLFLCWFWCTISAWFPPSWQHRVPKCRNTFLGANGVLSQCIGIAFWRQMLELLQNIWL